MRLRASFLAIVCLAIVAFAGSFVLASPATQEEPGSISQAWFLEVKRGLRAQFEEALLQHWEVHRQHNDPRPYTVFTIEDGERAGQDGILTGGNHWADLDAFEENVMAACLADFGANAAQYVEYYTGITTAGLQVAYPDHRFPAVYGRLLADSSRRGETVPTMDLLIATAAAVEDTPLVTRNKGDFARVSGLRLITY